MNRATRRCAFLTLADPADYVIDDELSYAPLAERGWQVDAVPWQAEGVTWADYDVVVIRSTWDYHDHPDAFLRRLAEIDASRARLENPLEIVRWNLNKTYLRALAERGVATVPTLWRERLVPDDLPAFFDALETDEVIIKPQVGANAEGAFRLERGRSFADARDYFRDRPLMAQPMVRSVLSAGEYSLFYFRGAYSHAITKTPASGDFRSQEEHGAAITALEPDAGLLAAGAKAMAAVGESLLYARADFLACDGPEEYWLIELELIEPSLYLRMDPDAPARFAAALDAMVR